MDYLETVTQSRKIMSVSITNRLTSEKPSNAFIGYSNWASGSYFMVLPVPYTSRLPVSTNAASCAVLMHYFVYVRYIEQTYG